MSKFKFLTALGLLLLFILTSATSSEARNRPRVVDHQDQFSHPWGGDENSGGSIDFTATPVQPDIYNQYRYINGSKTGMLFGAVQFLWDNVEVYFLSYTRGGAVDGGKISRGSGMVTQSAGSNSLTSGESGGKGGK